MRVCALFVAFVVIGTTSAMPAEGAPKRITPPPEAEVPLPTFLEISEIKRRSSRHVKKHHKEPAPASQPSGATRPPPQTPPPTGKPSTPTPGTKAPTLSPPPPPASGDTTETIDTGLGDTEVIQTLSPFEESEPILPPTTRADRFQFSGWAKSLVALGLGPPGYQAGAPSLLALPYDRIVSTHQLYLRLHYARGEFLEAVGSGIFKLSVLEQDPRDPKVRFNGFNGAETTLTFEPEVRDLYVGGFFGPVDIRVGQQAIAWGKGDLFTPNDVVNPHDQRLPFLEESELLRLPVFMVRADFDVVIGSLQLVYVPFFTPDRLDVYGSNWSLWQPDTPVPDRVLLNYLYQKTPPERRALFREGLRGGHPLNMADGQGGLRFTATVGQWDFGLYYHYGLDRLPRLKFPQELVGALYNLDYSRLTVEDLDALNGGNPTVPDLHYEYGRRHHVGFDVGTVFGPIALRLDAAFEDERAYSDRYLRTVIRPTIAGTLSIEYQTGEFDKAVLLEVSYLRLLGKPVPPLLLSTQDNLGAALVARWLLFKYLVLEVRGLIGILPFSYGVRPEIGVKVNGFNLRVGTVLLGGADYSFGSYFRRNRSVYLTLRYSF